MSFASRFLGASLLARCRAGSFGANLSSQLLPRFQTASANLLQSIQPRLQSQNEPFLSILCRFKHTFKTNKSVAKRFRVRGGSGRKKSVLTHMCSGAQHNTGYRARASINKLAQSKPMANKKIERRMKMCMGVM
jgi:ribosomal protein L35